MSVAPVPLSASGTPVSMIAPDATFTTSAVFPRFALGSSLRLASLSESETALVARLGQKIVSRRYLLDLRNAYYEGTFRLADLGISIPPQMRGLKVALGWCRTSVDALNSRLGLEGFRFPDSNDVDEGMQDIWLANRMDSESQMAHLDALVFGSAYASVGSNPDNAELPIITVESPLDLVCDWDARTRKATAALRLFGDQGVRSGTLYLPDETISVQESASGWIVTDRDVHKLGVVPVERITNRPRSHDRDGASEITPELMNVTDAACRTLLGLEVAREFYSAPQRYILGADESAFMDASGNARSGWETYMGRVLALERDADGNVPTVGQFTPYDPGTFTKIIDMYARIVSSMTSLPPHVLGFTTDNPASADAIRSSENALVMKANYRTASFGADWAALMGKALMVRDGRAQEDAHRISPVWASTATPTPAATTDAVLKQIQSGYLPATSDVTGEKLGYTPLERARIEQDRRTDQGASLLSELAHSIGAKDLKAGVAIANESKAATAPAVPPAAVPVTPPSSANPA